MKRLFSKWIHQSFGICVAGMWCYGFVLSLLQIVQILLQSWLINETTGQETRVMTILWVIIACFIAYVLLKAVYERIILMSGLKVETGIRKQIGVKLNRMLYPELERYDCGTIYSMASNDSHSISEWYQSLLTLGYIAFQIAVTLVLCLYLSPLITGILIPCGVIAIVIPSVCYKGLYQKHKTEKSTENQMNAKLIHTMRFLTTIKLYCLEAMFMKDNRELLISNGSIRKKISYQTEKGTRAGIMFGHVTTAAVFVSGAYFIMEGHLTLGNLYAVILVSGVFGEAMSKLITILPKHKAYKAANDRIKRFLDQSEYGMEELPFTEEQDSHSLNEKMYDHAEQIADDKTYELKDLSYSYLEDEEVLHHLNLSITQGEKIAVIGASGSGKTTLFKLLSGLYPIRKEEIQARLYGKDMKELSLQQFNESVSIMSQETVLLNDTIYQNIALYHSMDKEEVYSLCQRLGLHDTILNLPQGYDTVVSSLYDKLSRGQIQRIGFARILLQRRQILLLDEPLSALDQESGERVHRMIMSEAKDKTVIMICHKLLDPEMFDRIMVLEEGSVAGFAPHSLLIKECTLYQRMMASGLAMNS